jgi:hypothetical protein
MRPPLQERSLHHDPQPAEPKKLLAYVIGIGASANYRINSRVPFRVVLTRAPFEDELWEHRPDGRIVAHAWLLP